MEDIVLPATAKITPPPPVWQVTLVAVTGFSEKRIQAFAIAAQMR